VNDDRLVKVFQDGVDFHMANAISIFGENATKEQRGIMKTTLYGVLYGIGINKLSKSLKVSRKEAKRIYNLLVEKFPALFELRDAAIESTKEGRGIIHTLLGRRLVYKNVMSFNSETRSRSERQIFNALLQGTAADLMKQLTVDSLGIIYKYDALIAASVHDELILYAPTSIAHELAIELTTLWSSSQYLMPVPIVAEFKVGSTWSEIH
jgi:DNA polymerase I